MTSTARWLSVSFPLAIILLSTVAGRADTIQLNFGPPVTATVTKYVNHTFEARTADGKTVSYPASNVRRIAFENSKARANFVTRNYGPQEGTPSLFENGAFQVVTATGVRKFPLIFVERAAFIPERGQEVEVIGHGSQVDIARHLSPGNVTIVDFYADWCGPCKMISPFLEQLAKARPGDCGPQDRHHQLANAGGETVPTSMQFLRSTFTIERASWLAP